jgi:hypothetical protein
MAAKTPIPFAAWEPDRSELVAPAMIRGVLSKGGTYVPFPSLTSYRGGVPLNDAAIGAATCYAASGSAETFLGDRSRLYRMASGAPADVSQPGGYAADADWAWQFCQFGDNIIAVAGGVTPQRYQLGTSTLFADLGGAPPSADCAGRIRQWLFLAKDRIVSVSGINNVTDWTYDLATQGLQTTLSQEAGRTTKIIGGENGAIFQERGITRVAFTGGAIPFLFDEIEGGRGCASPNGVSTFGRVSYVVAEDGFYIYDGLETKAIGAGRVDDWWTERLNYGYRHRISCAFDARRKTWLIAYPTGGATSPTEILAYNVADNRWTYTELPTHLLFEMPYAGASLDDDAAIAALAGTTDLDSIAISVDSPLWAESRRQWAAVGETRAVSLFTGAPVAATVQTSTFEPTPGLLTHVTELWPITDAASADVTGTLLTRLHTRSAAETSNAAPMIDQGFCPVRTEGRYLRAQVDIAAGADWTEVNGVHVDGRVSGGR